jgi:hypothetical protein
MIMFIVYFITLDDSWLKEHGALGECLRGELDLFRP